MVKVKIKESKLDLIARNVAEIKETMATKEDLKNFATKIDLGDMERRLSNKIDAVDEKLMSWKKQMLEIYSIAFMFWKKT
ncbi:MAG: hypothetical protein WD989_02270 [Candidatus Paceibacterota bacterium]